MVAPTAVRPAGGARVALCAGSAVGTGGVGSGRRAAVACGAARAGSRNAHAVMSAEQASGRRRRARCTHGCLPRLREPPDTAGHRAVPGPATRNSAARRAGRDVAARRGHRGHDPAPGDRGLRRRARHRPPEGRATAAPTARPRGRSLGDLRPNAAAGRAEPLVQLGEGRWWRGRGRRSRRASATATARTRPRDRPSPPRGTRRPPSANPSW